MGGGGVHFLRLAGSREIRLNLSCAPRPARESICTIRIMGKSSSSTTSNNDPSDNKHEQKLQAVLLADTFSNAFHPITYEPFDISSSNNLNNNDGANNISGGKVDNTTKGRERPLILCPLNNVPLLHHTIDFLQGSGVEELFLLCSNGADVLEEYIRMYAGSVRKAGNNNAMSGGKGGGDDGGGSSREYQRSNSSVEGNKIIWSSKLTISLLRFTDCTNAGE